MCLTWTRHTQPPAIRWGGKHALINRTAAVVVVHFCVRANV